LNYNLISKIQHTENLYNLDVIELAHNNITSVLKINEVLGNIKALNLRANKILYTSGLDKLYALEHLNISNNLISSLEEIKRLAVLPFLQTLNLKGNPVDSISDYRDTVLKFFYSIDRQFCLDGIPFRTEEWKYIGSIMSVRTDPVSSSIKPSDTSISTVPAEKKKKKKRIAAIDDVNHKKVEPIAKEALQLTSAGDFETKVENLREQGGTSWLLILNELQDGKQKLKI